MISSGFASLWLSFFFSLRHWHTQRLTLLAGLLLRRSANEVRLLVFKTSVRCRQKLVKVSPLADVVIAVALVSGTKVSCSALSSGLHFPEEAAPKILPLEGASLFAVRPNFCGLCDGLPLACQGKPISEPQLTISKPRYISSLTLLVSYVSLWLAVCLYIPV